MTSTVSKVLREARRYLGIEAGSAAHRFLIDTYNGCRPLPRGYTMTYEDDWCDAFVSAIAILTDTTAIMERECGVQAHVHLFQQLGIWLEDGTLCPQAGDLIVFSFRQAHQPNQAFADHIGFVEAVSEGLIVTIEGNVAGRVVRRQYPIGDGTIRGFARPRYLEGPSAVSQDGGGQVHERSWVEIAEQGCFYPSVTLNVRDYPSTQANIVAQYNEGESCYYDAYVVNEGYIWLGYQSYSGERHYVAWRRQQGECYGRIE